MKQWCAAFVICSLVLHSQELQKQFLRQENSFAVCGGMSINAIAATSVVDYVNSVALYSQRVDDFASAVDFFIGVEFPVGSEWGLKFEHSYLFKSYNILSAGGNYDFFYSVHAPSLLVHKVVTGEGYFFKMGAGGGYHVGSAEQKDFYGLNAHYTATGIGVKGELTGQTAFDENFFGYISGHLGWEFLGELEETTTKQKLSHPGNASETVKLNYFFAGIRFGVIYYL